jgi:hypothetical protein
VVVLARAGKVDDIDEKRRAMTAMVEHVLAGRSHEARAPSDDELRKTLVLSLPIDEASAKVRTGPPIDDDDDLALPVWAGVIPLRTVYDPPIVDPLLPSHIPLPPSVVACGLAG